MIGIDLRKQQTLDAYPKAIQKVNFTGNLARQATVFSLLKKQKKKTSFMFFTRNCQGILIFLP